VAWITAEDVTSAWIGTDAPDDVVLVEKWIAKAERLIRSNVPGIQDRIAAGTEPDLLDNAGDVVIDMVTRKFRNPEGLRQVQETTGPFSGSRTYGGTEPGSLYLTDDELKKLTLGTSGGQHAFSVSMFPTGWS
jgi:hypothetical protein